LFGLLPIVQNIFLVCLNVTDPKHREYLQKSDNGTKAGSKLCL
jgi:hypothetical protein